VPRRLLCSLVGVLALAAVAGAAPASALTGVGPVSLSSTAAGATGVTYSIGFSTDIGVCSGPCPSLIANSGTVTVTAPKGTVLPGSPSAYAFRDATTATSFGAADVALSSGLQTATITVGATVAAGDSLTLTIAGVTNPAAAETGLALTVGASTERLPATTPAYATTAPQALSGVTAVALSSPVAGASAVSYTVGFAASSSGALVANHGTLTVAAPPGTVFPSAATSYAIHDLSNATSFGAAAVVSNGGATATLTVQGTVNPGDQLTLTIAGVTNPSPAAIGLTLVLSSSSDTNPATTPPYATATPRTLSGLTAVSLSSSIAGATGVTYSIGFAASSAGGLSANQGTVTVAALPGTVFPNDGSLYAFRDLTSTTLFGATVAVTNGGATAILTVRGNVNPGDSLALTMSGVTNPSASGTYELALSSSSDTVPVGSSAFALVAPPPVNGRSVDVSPVSGTVLIRLPGQKGFTLLTVGEQIPVGATIDVTHGKVLLVSATDSNGDQQSADFYGGKFVVGQHHGKALTTLKLTGGNLSKCKRMARDFGGPLAREARGHPQRHLWGSGHGSFRTVGSSASGTVRGTIWLTEDQCDGTLVRVKRGVVSVQDFVRRKTIMVHAGHSYFAHKR
jgi:hypothetical protein